MTAGESREALRARLVARLAHRLESSLLLVREAAERGDSELLVSQLDELGSRARGLARCCVMGEEAREALREALADWMGPDARWTESGEGFEVAAQTGRGFPEAAELGEPLTRLLAAEAGAEVVSWAPGRAVIGG